MFQADGTAWAKVQRQERASSFEELGEGQGGSGGAREMQGLMNARLSVRGAQGPRRSTTPHFFHQCRARGSSSFHSKGRDMKAEAPVPLPSLIWVPGSCKASPDPTGSMQEMI